MDLIIGNSSKVIDQLVNEEFVKKELDWKYRATIPWGMVKIIMDLLE